MDLIIGTQIVAKGWHFPHLTLVGVVDADLGLAGGDLRAAERTLQLLHQVAGRAGRAEAPGRVLLQSFTPEHPVMRRADPATSTLSCAERQTSGAAGPAALRPAGGADRVGAEEEREVESVARDLGLAAPGGDGVEVLARRRRRWPCCAAATAVACWSKPAARRIYKARFQAGWRASKCLARCDFTWISTPTAFCDFSPLSQAVRRVASAANSLW